MGSLTAVLLGILGFAGAVVFAIIVRQGSDEFKAWTPRLTSKLLGLAIGKLPEEQRARMREEWAAHIEETPGEIGKWVEAAGFFLSAKRTAKAGLVIKTDRPQEIEHTFPKALRHEHDIDMAFCIDANINRHFSIQSKVIRKSFVIMHYSDVHFLRDRPDHT